MGGFDMAMKREEALPRAIQSGIDVLVFNTDIDEDLAYLKDGLHRGLLTEERLDDAVLRILAMKKRMEKLKKIVPEKVPARIRKEVADRSITLVKSKDDALPLTLEKYESIELIPLGNDHCPDGSITERVKTRFEKAGYPVTVFDIDQVEMHGPKKLNPKVLHLYLCNEEAASNRITVRISWQKKHALDGPRFVNEVPYVFVSFANPYHLQDIPRVKDFVNAYTADKDVIDALVDKLLGKSDFKGRSPVDAFCGLEDTRI
jgi:beta-N-acetylhexosaminidase